MFFPFGITKMELSINRCFYLDPDKEHITVYDLDSSFKGYKEWFYSTVDVLKHTIPTNTLLAGLLASSNSLDNMPLEILRWTHVIHLTPRYIECVPKRVVLTPLGKMCVDTAIAFDSDIDPKTIYRVWDGNQWVYNSSLALYTPPQKVEKVMHTPLCCIYLEVPYEHKKAVLEKLRDFLLLSV